MSAPTVEEVRAREAAGLPLWAWWDESGKARAMRVRVNDWDYLGPTVERDNGAQWYAITGQYAIGADWLGWCRTPDEMQATRRETATACADQAVYRLGQFVTDEEREELRTDILRAGGAL